MKDLQTVVQGIEKGVQSGIFNMKEVVILNNAIVGLQRVFEVPVTAQEVLPERPPMSVAKDDKPHKGK